MLSILVFLCLSISVALLILSCMIGVYTELPSGADGVNAKTIWSQNPVANTQSEKSAVSWVSASGVEVLKEIRGQILKSVSNSTYTYLAISASSAVSGTAPTSDLCLLRWSITDEKFDPDWSCMIKGTNTSVEVMTFDGVGRLYVGGSFFRVQFQDQQVFVHNIFRFSFDGKLDEIWKPAISGTVYAIDCTTSRVYIGGNFSQVGSYNSNDHFDFVDESGHSIWTSSAHNIDQNIYGCAVYGDQVYMCGNDDYEGGNRTFLNFGRADLYSGEMDTTWRLSQPDLCVGGTTPCTASCIAVDERVVFCGAATRDFDDAAADTPGNYSTWVYTGYVPPLPVGVAANRPLANINRTTGFRAEPWQISNSGTHMTAWYCASIDYERHERYLGGNFVNGVTTPIGQETGNSNVPRNNIARFKNSNTLDHYGEIDADWDPDADDHVYCIQHFGDYVYVGGRFTTLGGVSAPYFGRVSRTGTGALDTSWMPAVNGIVRAMAISGDAIYFGGDFTSVAGQTRNRAAAVKLSSMQLLDWNPNIGDGSVYAMAVANSYVFIGGSFTYPFPYLVRCSARSSVTMSTLARMNVNATVRCLLPHSAGGIFVGGDFTVDTGSDWSVNNMVAWDLESNLIDVEYTLSFNGPVYCIRTLKDDMVQYIGGQFSQVTDQSGLTQTLSLVVRYLLDTNLLDDAFRITHEPTGTVRVLELLGDSNQLLIGGSWSNTLTSKLARIDKGTGALDQTWLAQLNGDVVSLEKRDQTLVVWGTFSTVDSQEQEGLVVFKNWQLNPVRFFPTQRSISWVIPWQNENWLVSFSDRRLALLFEPEWEIVSDNRVKLA